MQLTAENILLKKSNGSSGRLAVIFSPANAKSFTFYNNSRDVDCDILYVRDPYINHWFQDGLFPGVDLADSVDMLNAFCRNYDDVSTFGSSMGGYAAILIGRMISANRILAIGPQTTLNHQYSRSPRKNVTLRIADLNDIINDGPPNISIMVGMLDAVDLYNSFRVDGSRNISSFYFAGEDHFLPKTLSRSGVLRSLIESHAFDRPIDVHPLSSLAKDAITADFREILCATVPRMFERRDYHGVCVATRRFRRNRQRVPVLQYLWAASAFKQSLFDDALAALRTIADKYTTCLDYNMLAAEAAIHTGQIDYALSCAKRVLKVRSGNSRAREIVAGLGVARAPETISIDEAPPSLE